MKPCTRVQVMDLALPEEMVCGVEAFRVSCSACLRFSCHMCSYGRIGPVGSAMQQMWAVELHSFPSSACKGLSSVLWQLTMPANTEPLFYCLIPAIEALDRLVAATIPKDCSGSCCTALTMLAGNSMVHYSADTSSAQVMQRYGTAGSGLRLALLAPDPWTGPP